MPVPMIRYGSSFIKNVSYTLSHGSSPQSFEAETTHQVAANSGDYFEFLISGSSMYARVIDVQQCVDEEGGLYSIIRGVDMRDDLFNAVVFARINIIDENDGSVYSEIEAENPFENPLDIEYRLFAWEIITWLCFSAGFDVEYSQNASDLLRVEEAALSWEDSRYNVFNIDWSAGTKIGPALDQMCDLLGLQFTIIDGRNKILRFTVKGQADFDDFRWDHGGVAVRRREGLATQPDVDTGVWIVGDRSVYEYSSVSLFPAWNEEWNQYALDGGLAIDRALIALFGAGFKPTTVLVSEFQPDPADPDKFADPGFLDGRFFNDMTIAEYLEKIVFYCYRMAGIENLLTSDEYNGLVKVRNNPIADKLVTDPSVEARVFVHPYNLGTKSKDVHVESEDTLQEITSGFKIYAASGHVVFDQKRFVISAAAKARTQNPAATTADRYMLPSDYEADACEIDIAVYGRTFRAFYGRNERVGSHRVSGLRKAYIVPDLVELTADHVGAAEYLLGGEKKPDWVAEDVAASLLSRRRKVRSGELEFFGVASHIPTGEIQRVTVSMNDQGITESLSYANDEPSPEYEPQLELTRKLAQQREIERLEFVKRDVERGRLRDLYAKAEQAKKDYEKSQELAIQQALEALNRDNYVVVKNAGGEDMAFGEPVVAAPDGAGFALIPNAEAEDEDERVIGVALQATDGKIVTVTSGIAHARVMGPIEQGAGLGYSKTDLAFIEGTGGGAIAMGAIDDATVQVIPVRLAGGAGGGESNVALADLCATLNIALSGLPTIDGVTAVAGDLILTPFQTTAADRKIWRVVGAGEDFVADSQPDAVIVKRGSLFTKRTFLLTDDDVYSLQFVGNETAQRCTVANLAATNGIQSVDGANSAAGTMILVKNHGTAAARGLYIAQGTGVDWTFLGQPQQCAVKAGTVNARLTFILTSANTYSGAIGVYG